MFFSFIFSLIGAVNSRNLVNIFVQKAYGFTTINEAKGFSNTTQIVSIFFGIALALVGTKFILKRVGEVKIIITCQYLSMIESTINCLVNNPIPLWCAYVTTILVSVALLYCDTLFLQLITMYTTP